MIDKRNKEEFVFVPSQLFTKPPSFKTEQLNVINTQFWSGLRDYFENEPKSTEIKRVFALRLTDEVWFFLSFRD